MTEFLQIHEPGQTPTPHADEEIAVGIDLGTTNSLVAISREGKPEVLRGPDGRAIIPSIAAYLDGRVVVGEPARRILLDEPNHVVVSIKRLMGRGVEDIKLLRGALPYDIDYNADTGGMARLKLDGKSLTPVEISADILLTLKARAEMALERPVDKAVITVPAYFDDSARAATRRACARPRQSRQPVVHPSDGSQDRQNPLETPAPQRCQQGIARILWYHNSSRWTVVGSGR